VDYSVIIPAYNEEEFLPDTLSSVKLAMEVQRAVGEIVVVDNNSSDRTAEIARTSGARVVCEPFNQISKARNTGAFHATGRYLIFLDADTLISEQLLKITLENLGSGRCAGGGSTVLPDIAMETGPRKCLDFWNALSIRFHIAAGSYIYCIKEGFQAVGGFSERVYASEEIWFSIAYGRWARKRGMHFTIITEAPVITSIRKLDWFSPFQIIVIAIGIGLFPFGLFSRRFCRLWYWRP
jgi:glycosyltransferase involved in cell wall biosynthesis